MANHFPLPSRQLRTIIAVLGLACFIAVACGHSRLHAQTNPSSAGRHFILAFPDTLHHLAPFGNAPQVQPTGYFIIFSRDTARVHVAGPGIRRDLVVRPGASGIVTSPLTFIGVENTASTNVFDITADRDITIYCYFTTPYGSEAYTALPVECWGTDYVAMGVPGLQISDIYYPNGPEESMGSPMTIRPEIIIIAAEPTHLTVSSPKSAHRAWTASFDLGAGQALAFHENPAGFQGYDLSGATIHASRPVGVLSGTPRWSNVRAASIVSSPVESPLSNLLVEWTMPVSAHGTTFVIPVLSVGRAAASTIRGEQLRMYMTSPGVTMIEESPHLAGISFPEGSVIEFQTDIPNPLARSEIRTSQPAEAAIITTSYVVGTEPEQFTLDTWGPAMTEATPHHRWLSNGRFHAPAYPPNLKHYVSIVADSAARVWLDGIEIAFGPAAVSRGFNRTWVEIGAGDHVLYSRDGLFSAIALGQAPGFIDYRPIRTKRADDRSPLGTQHASSFEHRLPVSYAYPVAGENLKDAAHVYFDSISSCTETVREVNITNSHGADVRIDDVRIQEGDGAFSLEKTTLPAIVPADSALPVRVRFHPRSNGLYTALIVAVWLSPDGTTTLDTAKVVIEGHGIAVLAAAAMPADRRAAPGDTVDVPITVDRDLGASNVTDIRITLPRRPGVLLLASDDAAAIARLLPGTLLAGWSVAEEPAGPDSARFHFTPPPGDHLRGAGTLLRTAYRAFLGDSTATTLSFSLEATAADCVLLNARAGLVTLDSLCGLRTRLIEFTAAGFAIDGIHPNPFNPTADITFSLGTEGPARLVIYDVLGRQVAVLVDDILDAGQYHVEWDASRQPSGLYYCRLMSGTWSATAPMVLFK